MKTEFLIVNEWSCKDDIPKFDSKKIEHLTPYQLSDYVTKFISIIREDGKTDKWNYDRIVIIKGFDLHLIEDLITKTSDNNVNEEGAKRINFGVFFAKDEDRNLLLSNFEKTAKLRLQSMNPRNRSGRIFSLEINGTGSGLGVVAGDDKIHVWRDK